MPLEIGALYGDPVDIGAGVVGAAARAAFFAGLRADFLADLFALFLAAPFFAPFFLADRFPFDDFLLAALAPFFFLAMVIPNSHGW